MGREDSSGLRIAQGWTAESEDRYESAVRRQPESDTDVSEPVEDDVQESLEEGEADEELKGDIGEEIDSDVEESITNPPADEDAVR